MEVAEVRGRVMASELHVVVVAVDSSRGGGSFLNEVIRDGIAHIEHLERCWSRFLETSDVSCINRLGPTGGTVRVDPTTITLLEAMIEGYRITAGRFDPTVLRSMVAEGYDASREDSSRRSVLAGGVTRAGSLLELELDPRANSVTVPDGLVVDPGGIGKGLAADLAVSRLLELGADGAMVGIGGDLAVAGRSPDPAGWIIDVEYPDPEDGLLCSLAIEGGGVATSSTRSRRWSHAGVERHHQIDPRTATCSTTDLDAVSVVASCGWRAEVHATAALATGRGGVISYLEGHGLSGIAVSGTPDGQMVLRTGDLVGIVLNEPGTVS